MPTFLIVVAVIIVVVIWYRAVGRFTAKERMLMKHGARCYNCEYRHPSWGSRDDSGPSMFIFEGCSLQQRGHSLAREVLNKGICENYAKPHETDSYCHYHAVYRHICVLIK